MSTLKDRLTPEEWKAYRSAVNAKYHRSEKGQAVMRRQNASPKAAERYARYRLTDKYRAAQDRRRLKEMDQHWPKITEWRRRLRQDHPEVDRAWNAVLYAIRDGVLVRPASCSKCGAIRVIHAHHHLGYDETHALDVVWLCVPCHKAAHHAR